MTYVRNFTDIDDKVTRLSFILDFIFFWICLCLNSTHDQILRWSGSIEQPRLEVTLHSKSCEELPGEKGLMTFRGIYVYKRQFLGS